jgi:putative PIN family toxin of toxin-antitoxin system
MTIPTAVFDCMVYLQAAARASGPARACLRLVQQGRVLLVISPPIFAELEDVLNRPKVRQKFRSLDSESVAVFLADITHLATSILDVPHVVSFSRDAKDEPYLNLALKAGARYIVTWDDDLLSHASHAQHHQFHDPLP